MVIIATDNLKEAIARTIADKHRIVYNIHDEFPMGEPFSYARPRLEMIHPNTPNRREVHVDWLHTRRCLTKILWMLGPAETR